MPKKNSLLNNNFRTVKSTNAERDNSACMKSQVKVSDTTQEAPNEGKTGQKEL